jgi:hypothetical protein
MEPPKEMPQIPLGSVVRVNVNIHQPFGGKDYNEDIRINLTGPCQLYVVGHFVDSSETSIYVVSDLPVVYPVDSAPQSETRMKYHFRATVVEYFFEEDIKPIGQRRTLHPTFEDYFESY